MQLIYLKKKKHKNYKKLLFKYIIQNKLLNINIIYNINKFYKLLYSIIISY